MKLLMLTCLSIATLGMTPLGAQAPAPELDVVRPPNVVADGGQDTLSIDYFFGANSFVWYWLENNGSSDLSIAPLTAPSACANCTATVTQQPPAIVPPGSNAIIEIRLRPIAAGAFSFNLSISSDDADENPYDWTVLGNAIPAPAPEIELSRAGAVLVTNVADQVGSGHTAGAGIVLDYIAANVGSADLLFGQTYYSYSGLVNCSFSALQTIPVWPAYVAPGADEHYVLEVTPLAPGPFSMLIHIPNNDPDEGPFKLRIAGTAIAPTPGAIAVHRQGQTITSGSTDHLGTIGLGSRTTVYTISNPGMLALNLMLPLAAPSSLVNVAAQIVSQPSTGVVAGGSSVTFTIAWAPLALGDLRFGLRILSDAVNQPDLEWTLAATVAELPEFQLTDAAGSEIGIGTTLDVLRGTGGVSVSYRFVLTNTGPGVLALAGMPTVELTDLTNCQASVTAMPAQALAPGETAGIDIVVTPQSDGHFTLRILIANNDADEAAFWFEIDGRKRGSGEGGEASCSASASALQGTSAASLLGMLAVAVWRRRRQSGSSG